MKHRSFLKLPLTLVSLPLLIYAACTMFAMFAMRTLDWTAVRRDMESNRGLILVIGGLAAGFARVLALHPRYLTKYSAWLMATPWRPGLPLPLGPIHLVWEDLLLLLPMAALARFDAGYPVIVPVGCYLIGHTAAAVFSVRGKPASWFYLAIAFLMSFLVLFFNSLTMLWATVIALSVLSHVAIAASLKHFPWDLPDPMREVNRLPNAALAWPLNRVGPVKLPEQTAPSIGWLTAATLGWWTFVILSVVKQFSVPEFTATLAGEIPMIVATFSFVRIIQYCGFNWPPISTFGRLATGRLIIPGYDYVFIAPALACVIAFGLPPLMMNHVPPEFISSITVTAVCGLLINFGPSLRRWRLTGHHRVIPVGQREPAMPKQRTARSMG